MGEKGKSENVFKSSLVFAFDSLLQPKAKKKRKYIFLFIQFVDHLVGPVVIWSSFTHRMFFFFYLRSFVLCLRYNKLPGRPSFTSRFAFPFCVLHLILNLSFQAFPEKARLLCMGGSFLQRKSQQRWRYVYIEPPIVGLKLCSSLKCHSLKPSCLLESVCLSSFIIHSPAFSLIE